jgi:hypothetical protein
MTGKCLRTFTGNFFLSWSLNLELPYFGQVVSFAYSPQKSTHPLSHAWMLVYANPNFFVNVLAA